MPSSQLGAGPGWQMPARQLSVVVQTSPSEHMVPSGCGAKPHRPVDGVQTPGSSQGPASGQSTGGPGWHKPFRQTSVVVQGLASSQPAVLLTWRQPLVELQLSLVHGLLSSQVRGVPGMQTPSAHASPIVQASPSEHAATSAGSNTQPWAGSQLSVVHGSPSSHVTTPTPTHRPAAQLSVVVQRLPSLQGGPLAGTSTQPLAGTHPASWHGPSPLHRRATPLHTPLAQRSLTVHASSSLHSSVLAVNTQPCSGWQLSSVQSSPSSQ